jgi:hypothetical protein
MSNNDNDGSGFNGVPGSVSRSGFAIRIRIQDGKNYPQTLKKLIKFICLSAECSVLRAEGFFFSFEISTLQFLMKNKKIFSCIFFFSFWSSKPWIRIRIHVKCRIRIRIQ